ncbi:MAG: hypothetical protein ACTHN4_05045 [Sphingomicrobium sp.]
MIGDFQADGYAHIRELVPPEVARAIVARLKEATRGQPIPLSKPQPFAAVLKHPAFDVSSDLFRPLETFLWGLTPTMSRLIGKDVLPSYTYFRIYLKDDICRVHSDRPSSEFGLSLTLEYSDDKPWDLQVGKERIESLYPLSDDFGSMDYASVEMQVGDAVLYQGSHYAHGRMQPNPNKWSAHLFLFFVDRNGPYAGHAFDEKPFERVDFTFV